MPVLYANRAFSTLASGISNSATSLSVASGQGARFPAISGGDYFYCTLDDNAGNVEIVKVTARSTDTFTIVRAQDGTSGLAFNAGAGVELRIVRALLDDFKTDTRAGNAATATTLQTTRTLWGQNFNGSANVSGALTGVTDITLSGTLAFSPWANDRVVIKQEFDASYYQRIVFDAANRDLRIQSNSGDALARVTFWTGSSGTIFERMRLDASGNLGLGVTPSAWGAAYPGRIQGLGWSIATPLDGGTDTSSFATNAYNSAGSTWNYRNNASAALYQQFSASHLWYTAPSGTAGNAISFTQVMTLDASGNLLVGTTSAATRVTVNLTNAYDGITLRTTNEGPIGLVGMVAPGSNNDIAIGTLGNNNLRFFTNGTANERARITSGGDFGFGQSPDTNRRFCIRGSGTTSGGFTFAVQNSGPTDLFLVRNDGAIYLGLASVSPYNLTTASAANAHLASDGYMYRSTSSRKYKTDIQDATHGLAEVMALRPVTYRGASEADGDTVFGGLIAEEVHEAGLSEFVQYAPDGSPDALAYGNMVALLTKAIQEQQALIASLTARVAALETKH